MPGKSTHLQVIPQQIIQKQQTCGYRHTRKASELFYFSSRNNFVNLGSFANLPVLVGSMIPLLHSKLMLKLPLHQEDNSQLIKYAVILINKQLIYLD